MYAEPESERMKMPSLLETDFTTVFFFFTDPSHLKRLLELLYFIIQMRSFGESKVEKEQLVRCIPVIPQLPSVHACNATPTVILL